MCRLKFILQSLYSIILIFSASITLTAQPAFLEGSLIYKADTVKRLEAFPAGYVVSQMVVYKKADQIRIEIWRVNTLNKNDTRKDVHIRNKKGVYTYVELSDSVRSEFTCFAMFMSYDEEKRHQAMRIMQGYTTPYKIGKVVQRLRWLDLPAQRVLLKGGPKNEESEMVLTNAIDLPIGLVFGSILGEVPGTPLQFIVHERGWMTRLKATELNLEKISDTLFELNPKFEIMSFDDMIQEISNFK